MNRGRAILAAVVIFICGTVTGAILTRAYAPRPPGRTGPVPPPLSPARRVEYIDRLARDADLTPGQRRRAEEIFMESQARIRRLWDPIAPQAREEMKRARKQIAGLLTPEQKARVEERHRQRRREKSENGPEMAEPAHRESRP